MVFLTDALSVLQALTAGKETELQQELQFFARSRRVALQWIPSHCGIPGNEKADELAKQGAQQKQFETCLSFEEKKTIIKTGTRT